MTKNNNTQDCEPETAYHLDAQVGFLLRRVQQRHLAIFFDHISDMTAMQFAALAKLCELGSVSQNELGRKTAMDAATIKGVVDRLRARGFADARPDPGDSRRIHLAPSGDGRALFGRLAPLAKAITADTLAPLSMREQKQLLTLLEKLT